jgi:hypothetical protein
VREAAGVTPVLAGSGSTWFVPDERRALREALAPARVACVRTLPPSADA